MSSRVDLHFHNHAGNRARSKTDGLTRRRIRRKQADTQNADSSDSNEKVEPGLSSRLLRMCARRSTAVVNGAGIDAFYLFAVAIRLKHSVSD
ncbi:MAG: hypothetical protein ACXU8U_08835 [Asticcacaulis sp.]